tara:strand:- start:462 stop:650 length:189 start_codon:yes stop_codon:yes gene_type:complete
MNIQPKDPSYNHFAVSLVKSVFRIVASGLLVYGGWQMNNYFIMAAGAGLFLAEVLGIIEEVV